MGEQMNEREYLVKAQEAEARANRSDGAPERREWEQIAREYRRLAQAVRDMRSLSSANDSASA